MSKIANLTQHSVSAEQAADGAFDLPKEVHAQLKNLLTFDSIPTEEEMEKRAEIIATLYVPEGVSSCLIGGDACFMPYLVYELQRMGIEALYAFSKRVAIDGSDGEKVSTFKHLGWRKATLPAR